MEIELHDLNTTNLNLKGELNVVKTRLWAAPCAKEDQQQANRHGDGERDHVDL